ncbi:MAG: SET domain-containing protein [Bacteroidia bacterium]|nr:SET domain-containing protein [Bacteroidia bacterium]
MFDRYAYPVSNEVFMLWDDDPTGWAPQNHCCEPNTGFDGLNVIALRNISKGEELTLDYANLLDETAQPFECRCGAANCRGLVTGTPNNSVNKREKQNKVFNGR